MHDNLGLPEQSLIDLPSEALRPSEAALEAVVARFRGV